MNSCKANSQPSLKANGYAISSKEDEISVIWAEYLYNHLKKRCAEDGIVVKTIDDKNKKSFAGFKNIQFEVNPDINYDYCIDHTSEELYITVRNKETALWITYQLISNIATVDSRFDVADLPIPLIDFDSECKSFDFSYREPYFRPNLNEEYSALIGTNNVERDWGLWGHNLSKVIQDPSIEDVYSLVNGVRNRDQFSFSSPTLFNNICEYIIDNYGDGNVKEYRFMIMPNDNQLVCTCPSCVALGNTEDNATPAVMDLIHKLADRFPGHMFFTTAYMTTSIPPTTNLPDNAGVFISTVSLPKGQTLDDSKASVKAFSKQLDKWSKKTSNIYLWDYAANFDDYLTPLPILYGLQKQLLFFRSHGVKGIFLNASGYDYSPFDDVKTFVAGALMMDSEINVKSLCEKYLEKEYPISHKLLSDYYLSAEHQFESKNKAYDMYGGINQIISSYLDVDRFIQFYEDLIIVIGKTEKEESDKLHKLLTALTYTRLQIAYVRNDKAWGAATKVNTELVIKPEIERYINNLEENTKLRGLGNYKESDGKLDNYITEWRKILSYKGLKNTLMGTTIKISSNSNESNDIYMLNDGMLGFSTDYHQGWYLSTTDDLAANFSAEKLRSCSEIKLHFLRMARHQIYPPEKVILIVDNIEIKSIDSLQMNNYGLIDECIIPIDFSLAKNIELKFIRKQGNKSTIACDEIVIN
ncbi:DUF4838 domain-containing protein [Dysgonomonas sp. Marseille-P4677]|uniref:DUF4838 domain-containing protein n=1 Tax=Dysgonomonas sp. Marseille-P4677 TaxID=2364790 RepID=UPI00191375F7|nr:DUF4838 domain-containing protein [Dysgonomonas sp. Marseille-P4677]MBK5722414.1 DUF4838 domain-containing protein [Dysgonomonas sp. Marseille-P4677]